MTGVELWLAFIGALDLRLRYGKLLLDKHDDFKTADDDIAGRMVIIARSWKKTAVQLDFIKQIWSSLDAEHQHIHEETLQILSTKLEIAVPQISKRWRYALAVKECLDKVTRELEEWQTRLDPSWYLIIRIADPAIDAQLAKTDIKSANNSSKSPLSVASRLRETLITEPKANERVFLPADDISEFRLSQLPFSTAGMLQKPRSSILIIDHAEYHPDTDLSVLTNDVRTLARQFRHVEPLEFNLFECFGVVQNRDPTTRESISFDFIFKIPRQMQEPQSLRAHLCSGTPYPLCNVFSIAKRLAISNIRPETDLIFHNGVSALGWSALTLRHGNTAWDQNLYYHPDRQGLLPEANYTMQHDIYSLGSLAVYEKSTNQPSLAQTLDKFPDFREASTKEVFVGPSTDVWPYRMGDKYSQVVIDCLTCMERENRDFGDETDFQDEDGVLIAVKYIEKILLQLDSISF
ncbi:hypothetical protein BDW59DRAFT_173295 [Aspergillus cavernicola]|uniref:Uncharacterized protein n=1 Tax=Aspergillus cavernicola TaxID=176166 RepID=A0ABR4I7C2_9EURO